MARAEPESCLTMHHAPDSDERAAPMVGHAHCDGTERELLEDVPALAVAEHSQHMRSYFTFHRSAAAITVASSWLTIFRLPPYSSEQLNEIEGLWRYLEEDYFSRMLVADPADFVSATVRLPRRLQKPGALRRVLKPRRPLR